MLNSPDGKWQAGIRTDGGTVFLGLYADEEQAAVAYDAAAKYIVGDDAILNFADRDTLAMNPMDVRLLSKKARGISGFIGVTAKRNRWEARLYHGGVYRVRAVFATQEEAARAYDEAAKEAFGEKAILNFKAQKPFVMSEITVQN